MKRLAVAALVAGVAASIITGCDVEVPPFPAGQGQKKAAITYPGGPYGVTKSSVITNFTFPGFPAPETGKDPNALVDISLSDFYNPTGDGVYPAGSPYGEGNPKPKALLIDIGAVWCAPCQYEAKVILPPLYEEYKPRGAEFFFDLADGAKGGVAATPAELVTWVTKYKSKYPSAHDPDRKLGASFKADAFPVNILIDTRTMVIVDVVAGVPDEGGAFFQSLEALLDK